MIGDEDLAGRQGSTACCRRMPAAVPRGGTPMDNATARSVFIIGPDKRIKATLTYPMSTGRNFAEILRLLDSIQLTAREEVATPANWEQGEDVIILPAVSNEAARAKYPAGWKEPLPYIRIVPQPGSE